MTAGAERRAALSQGENKLMELLRYYLGPTGIPNRLAVANEVLNPVRGIEDAGAASRNMLAPNVPFPERVASAGNMLSEVAGAVAPVAAGRFAGLTADDMARTATEAYTGISTMPTAVAGRDFAADQSGAINLDAIRAKFPDVKIDVSGNPKRGYTINRIVVPEGARGAGTGTEVMRDILRQADADGATVALSPSADFGGTVSRLNEFYKSLGFVANKGKAKDYAISESMYRTPKPTGIKGYHGSPHDFDQFSMDKIGAGEGAQTYGHGLYFAEHPETAKAYRDVLRSRDVVYNGQKIEPNSMRRFALEDYDAIGKEGALRNLQDNVEFHSKYRPETADLYKQEIEFINQMDPSKLQIDKGRMYEVNIDANPEDFLDFDKPFSEQPPNVQKHFNYLARGKSTPPDGMDLARRMEGNVWTKEAANAGIPGIRYLDQGSRGAVDVNNLRGTVSMWERAVNKTPNDEYALKMLNDAKSELQRAEGGLTRNYVVFDDKLISIIKKYGIAGAAPMLGMSAEELRGQYAVHELDGRSR